MEGARNACDQKLAVRFNAQCRGYREAEWRQLQPEETPAIGFEEGDQRLVNSGYMVEQDLILHLKVQENELTARPPTEEMDPQASGPLVVPLLNELIAVVHDVFLDSSTTWSGIQVSVVHFGEAKKAANAREASAEIPITLRYARLMANALGMA